MRHFKQGLTLAGIAALLLTACSGGGGGGSSSSSSSGGANVVPVANAGPEQTVTSATMVTLNGSASTDADGSIASYAWTQTAGTAVSLSSTAVAQPTFTAPTVTTLTPLTFSLQVRDNRDALSVASTVIINVIPPNVLPVANAGIAQTVTSGVAVTLNGSASSDADGSISAFLWTQTAGPAVTLSSNSVAQPTFTAPVVTTAAVLTFSLVVTDNSGGASAAATVSVTVNPLGAGNVNVVGKVRFARVPYSNPNVNAPLNYASPVLQPSRGVTVRALNAATQAQLATGSTDASGDYALAVPANTNVIIEVVARMQKTGAAPTWDVRVQDGIAGITPFTHQTAAFSSGAGVTRNIDMPTGVNASGTATGARVSAPFAILDTIFTATQAVLGVAPTTAFPTLIVDWGSQSQGTFFTAGGGQHIALLSNLTSDTDEFDTHVVAHEFGHYIEYNFSRADNIGGSHGLGDVLDPRVSFGEGFGYAFAAIVLNDPVARDSFVDNGTLMSFGFNIEINPSGTSSCWCSESSVWSILYDIADSASDTNDTLALGFQPIWNALTSTQKNTPALTTIFSFITAFKTAQPGNAAAINTLVAAQNIDAATIDAFATTESHAPANVALNAVLPLYTSSAGIPSAAIVLRNVDDAGNYNKLGNHRFIRMDASGSRSVTITASSSNPNTPDVDFLVYRAGVIVAAGTDPPSENPESETFNVTAGTYIIDVYDCANGCSTVQGTAGDYNLTVTIN